MKSASTFNQASPPNCPASKRARNSRSEPPAKINSAKPASKSAAETRSWLWATWPCSRACWRRYGVASCVFSALTSAIKIQTRKRCGNSTANRFDHEFQNRFDLRVEDPHGCSQTDAQRAEQDRRVESEAGDRRVK